MIYILNIILLVMLYSIGNHLNDQDPYTRIIATESLSELLYFPEFQRTIEVSENNKLFIPDWSNQRILIYNSDYEFVNAIGRPGRGPGEFGQLGKVSLSGDTLIAMDINRRISIFNLDGEFLHSFIISHHHYLGSIATIRINGELYIIIAGIQYDIDRETLLQNATVLHLYDLQGNLIQSFHRIPITIDNVDMSDWYLNFIFVNSIGKYLYLTDPVKYHVYRYSFDEDLTPTKELLIDAPQYFRPINMQVPPEAMRHIFSHPWLEENEKHFVLYGHILPYGLAVVTRTTTPTLYSIDIYDFNGKPIIQGLQINEILAGTNRYNGDLYFLKYEEKGGYRLITRTVKKEMLGF